VTIYQMGLPVLVVAYHSATTSTQLTQYQFAFTAPPLPPTATAAATSGNTSMIPNPPGRP
jgi:hypothetical protein